MLNDLKNCFFGGYSRIDTLRYIDKLTKELEMLEVAKENKYKGMEYTVPHHTEKVNLGNSLFGGYDKNDVDSVVNDILQRIDELRNEI